MRASVCSDCGDVVGTTLITETPLAGGTATAWATPSVDEMAVTSDSGAGPSTTTWSGPLKPGPNPSASRS